MHQRKRQSLLRPQSGTSRLLIQKRGRNCATTNFPSCRGWNARDKVKLLGALVFRQPFAAMLQKFGFRRAGGLVENNGSGHFFAQCRVGKSERDRCGYGGMLQQDFVHLVWRDVLATSNDDVFHPARQMEITIFVEEPFIASAEPSFHQSARIGFGIVFVTAKNTGSL